jgi:hypothetical protein
MNADDFNDDELLLLKLEEEEHIVIAAALINVILSLEDQSHLALLIVSNSTVTGAPPFSELEGLLGCTL